MSEPTLLEVATAHSSALAAADLAPLIQGVRELIELVNATSVTRVHLDVGSIRVEIEAAPTVSAVPALAAPGAPGAPQVPAPPAGSTIKAILVGVFYRHPGPGEPPFVAVGMRVEAGQQIAIVEAMKMMNPVVADRACVISEILVEDGDVVEFDQSLFTIEPC